MVCTSVEADILCLTFDFSRFDMRRFGRPVGSADSLSFIYFNEARNRTDEDHEENQSKEYVYASDCFIPYCNVLLMCWKKRVP